MELISAKRILLESGLAQTRLDDLNYFFSLSHTIMWLQMWFHISAFAIVMFRDISLNLKSAVYVKNYVEQEAMKRIWPHCVSVCLSRLSSICIVLQPASRVVIFPYGQNWWALRRQSVRLRLYTRLDYATIVRPAAIFHDHRDVKVLILMQSTVRTVKFV